MTAAKKQPNQKAKRLAQLQAQVHALQNEMAELSSSIGRPTLYKPEFAARATGLCMLGLTNKELGERFGVAEKTIEQWIREVPEFAGAVYDGREGADVQLVQTAFKAASGWSHPHDDIRTLGVGDGMSEIVITPTTKHYPPNYNFFNMLMMNRQRQRFPARESTLAEGGGGSTPAEAARAAREAIKAALAETEDGSDADGDA